MQPVQLCWVRSHSMFGELRKDCSLIVSVSRESISNFKDFAMFSCYGKLHVLQFVDFQI